MLICLLGVSFDTGNMGVSALAESSIKIILNRWPDAEVALLGTGEAEGRQFFEISGCEVEVRELRIRFCKNIFLRSHYCVLLLNALLLKLLPLAGFRKLLSSLNPSVKLLLETDKVFDLTGGDSFSDIYGTRRFLIYGFLQKWLMTLFGKELILLPQTYGPFKRRSARQMAKFVLKRADTIYARDHSSAECVRELLGKQAVNGKLRVAPDIAFILDPREPENVDVGLLEKVRGEDSIVVGLNISALLFNGGYSQENMFGLKANYRELMYDVVDCLMKHQKVLILLVPHVFTPDRTVEDDPLACQEIYGELEPKYRDRIFLARGRYDHREIKYIIGLCDFFIGSRMHACIAALSQSIPSVGIAYSKKFHGVFESIGIENCIADAYRCKKDELLSIIENVFKERGQIQVHLKKVIPEAKASILNMP